MDADHARSDVLQGVRVLDLTHALAGPFCTMILADLGADVIKLEPPSGDLTRTTPPHFVDDTSVYFIANNRGKRSIRIDLAQPVGRQVLHDLLRVSDVVVYNFSPRVIAKLGLDADSVHAINPRAVVCDITGYGRRGTYAADRAVDPVIQAAAGAMSITGNPGEAPARAGVPTADLSAGLFAVIGILGALIGRLRTDQGSSVSTSLYHSQLTLLNYMASYALFSGVDPGPVGSAHPGTVPSQAFLATDGWLVVDAGFDRQFLALCTVLGRDDLAADPRFATRRDRSDHRGPLLRELEKELGARRRQDLLDSLRTAGVPCAPVATVREALQAEPSSEYCSVAEVRSGSHVVSALATPIWFDDRISATTGAAPPLGGHTDEVLRELLGYSDDHLAALHGAGLTGSRAS